MTRGKKTIEIWKGMTFETEKICTLSDGRVRTHVSLRSPEKKSVVMERRSISARSLEQLEIKRRETKEDLWLQHKGAVIEMVRQKRIPELTFNLYRELRYDDVRIKKRWAGKAQEYNEIWERRLKRRFGTIPLQELSFKETTEKELAVIFSHSDHRAISEEEKACWIQLSDFYDALKEDGLLRDNPIKSKASKYRKSESEAALRNLSARSLTREELREFIEQCLRINDSSLRTCSLLHVLLGLNVNELCGLNLNSWGRQKNLSWLEIEREYQQGRGGEPKLVELLESKNQYRKVVCSSVVEVLLKKHVKQRVLEGAVKADPLFVENGVRLTPQSLKKHERELIDGIMSEGLHLAYKGTGRVRNQGRDRARTDILRWTAEHFWRNTAKLTNPMIAVLLGIDRIHTYAIWYVDWNNLDVMEYIKQHVELWHNEFIRIERKTPRDNDQLLVAIGRRAGQSLHGNAESGAYIELAASCGMIGYISSTEMQGDRTK